MSTEYGPHCEIVGIVSRRLIVRPSLCTRVLHRTCTCTCWLSTRALHGYCDCGTRARLLKILQHLMGLAQAISASGKSCFVCSTQSTQLAMPRYTRDYGKSSSWYAKGWAPPQILFPDGARGPLAVIIPMSGTRTHREDRPRPGGVQPETWADATEVRVKPARPMLRTERQQMHRKLYRRCCWRP